MEPDLAPSVLYYYSTGVVTAEQATTEQVYKPIFLYFI